MVSFTDKYKVINHDIINNDNINVPSLDGL